MLLNKVSRFFSLFIHRFFRRTVNSPGFDEELLPLNSNDSLNDSPANSSEFVPSDKDINKDNSSFSFTQSPDEVSCDFSVSDIDSMLQGNISSQFLENLNLDSFPVSTSFLDSFSKPNSLLSPYYSSFYYQGTGFDFSAVISNKGRNGEQKICFLLEKNFPESLLFPNVYIEWAPHYSSESDIVLLDKTGIYIIESKYWFCDVYGSEFEEFWRAEYHSSNSEPVIHYPRNPITQNSSHVKRLSLFLNLPLSFFVPIVVFNDLCNLHISTTSFVLSRRDLVSFLRTKMASRPPIFRPADLKNLSYFFEQCSYINTDLKWKHVDNIKSHYPS